MSPKKRYPKLALLDHFEWNIELNARNINGWTAFMFAFRIGHKNVVQLLLRQKWMLKMLMEDFKKLSKVSNKTPLNGQLGDLKKKIITLSYPILKLVNALIIHVRSSFPRYWCLSPTYPQTTNNIQFISFPLLIPKLTTLFKTQQSEILQFLLE